MSTTLVPSSQVLWQRLELIACGLRPGKTQACDRHRGKGAMFGTIAATGSPERIAAAICGTGSAPACSDCTTKATQLLAEYQNGTA